MNVELTELEVHHIVVKLKTLSDDSIRYNHILDNVSLEIYELINRFVGGYIVDTYKITEIVPEEDFQIIKNIRDWANGKTDEIFLKIKNQKLIDYILGIIYDDYEFKEDEFYSILIN